MDGRFFPWGDVLDPSWCCMRDSHAGRPLPVVVDSCAVDESPFGVRGMGGNVQDWCADLFAREGPPVPGSRVVPPVLPEIVDLDPASRRVYRGGGWDGIARRARCAPRFGFVPSSRYANLGLRPARSFLPSSL